MDVFFFIYVYTFKNVSTGAISKVKKFLNWKWLFLCFVNSFLWLNVLGLFSISVFLDKHLFILYENYSKASFRMKMLVGNVEMKIFFFFLKKYNFLTARQTEYLLNFPRKFYYCMYRIVFMNAFNIVRLINYVEWIDLFKIRCTSY